VTKRLSADTVQRYTALRRLGLRQGQAADEVGISRQSAHKLDRQLPPGIASSKELRERVSNPPKSWDDLSDLGKRCLEDFELFATTFFCLRVAPWWRIAAGEIVGLVLSSDEEFALLNGPSDSGKTTMAETLICWLLSGGGSLDPQRGRSMRFLFGGATFGKAERSVARIRQVLQSEKPVYNLQTRTQAEHSLVEVYGRYKPLSSEGDSEILWTRRGFTVAQVGDVDVSEKDPSVQAGSMKALPLSSRVDVSIWDDPARESDIDEVEIAGNFAKVAETRQERAGALIVIGQMLHAGDLYNLLAERTWISDDGEQHPTYHHLVFPAHFEERCSGQEHTEWDGVETGCLLDAVRLPWRRLQEKSNSPGYAAMFQQDVTTSSAGLVERVHIDGGYDSTNFLAPGCWDRERGFWEPVLDSDGKPYPSYVDCDPAQGGVGADASYWSFECWQVDPATKRRFLVYGDRGRYNIQDILALRDGAFVGILEHIVFKAATLGIRPSAFVVEENAARMWLRTDLFGMWQRAWSDMLVIPFHVQKNRNDPAVGVAALLQPAYRNGEVRLPGAPGVDSRNFLKAKVEELTKRRPRHDDTIFSEYAGVACLDQILDHVRRPGPTPNIDLRGLPTYLRRRREPAAKPRPRPAGLGSYALGERVSDFDRADLQ
jgi:hypothetical protein